MDVRRSFGKALKLARLSKSLTQEAFSVPSSRTFISLLERGGTSPTLEKLDSLCAVLDVHPVSLLGLAYLLDSEESLSIEQLVARIDAELRQILAREVAK